MQNNGIDNNYRIGADKSPASPSTPLTHSEDNANYSESDSSYVDKKRK